MNKILLICTAIVVLLNGCGGGDKPSQDTINNLTTPTATSSFDETLRGEWIYVSDGKKVYIDENFNQAISKVDDTLIVIQKDGVDYHLIRYGINTTTVTGDLYQSTDSQQSLQRATQTATSRIGNINIVLKHYLDETKNKSEDLDSTGEFEFTNVQTGNYTFEANTEENDTIVSAKVDVYGEEISIGSFKLVSDDGDNFKTEYTIDNTKNGYLFGDQTLYTGKLIIKNIGKEKGTGLNYTFSSDSPYIAQMSTETVLGTVDVNESINIPFNITFNILDKTMVSIPINVLIKDAVGNSWTDTFFMHVYQTPMYLHIATQEANIKGYIINEAHELTQVDTGDATIILPYKAGESYYLVLSNPNVNNETSYSIGLDVDTLDFENFQDTSAYEPNNKEEDATVLKMRENIISYLHEGDIDYYKLDMSGSTDTGVLSPPQMPFK
jgi:hypothetical protein